MALSWPAGALLEGATDMKQLASAIAALALSFAAHQPAQAQGGVVNALCSTDASWCEAAAAGFSRSTGIKVNQAHKGTGEMGAQLRAEAANPKTDIWWGGTGDPFLQAAEQGLLEAYRPAYVNDLHEWAVRQYANVRQHGRRVLYERDRLRLQHRRAQEEEPAGTEVLGRPGQAGVPVRDRDLAPGDQRWTA